MLDSRALTKIQSAVLVAIIVVAAVGGGAAYVLWSGPPQSAETIRIGVCADLDGPVGKTVWQAAVLAAEQINAKGGLLGRNLTIVAEDDDAETAGGQDVALAVNALTKLITVDKADYIITPQAPHALAFQDVCSEHKRIMFSVRTTIEQLTQRVLDDYDKYKYFFRVWSTNSSSTAEGVTDSLLALRNYTGFNKIAYLITDVDAVKPVASSLDTFLPANGFDLVYKGLVSAPTTDFTSYFAAIEASGAQIVSTLIVTQASTSLVKEWYDRQSPVVLWGSLNLAQEASFWNLTEGKCEYISFVGLPAISGYPLTTKTVPTREAYIERWGSNLKDAAVAAYDVVRFILPDAIKRAGTTETEAVIKALETTDVETSMARHFVFTTSHDVMVGAAGPNHPAEDYLLVCQFQWQNGVQVPVYPEAIMKEAVATYMYPPWQGPWSD